MCNPLAVQSPQRRSQEGDCRLVHISQYAGKAQDGGGGVAQQFRAPLLVGYLWKTDSPQHGPDLPGLLYPVTQCVFIVQLLYRPV